MRKAVEVTPNLTAVKSTIKNIPPDFQIPTKTGRKPSSLSDD